jgi:hypothetical protein
VQAPQTQDPGRLGGPSCDPHTHCAPNGHFCSPNNMLTKPYLPPQVTLWGLVFSKCCSPGSSSPGADSLESLSSADSCGTRPLWPWPDSNSWADHQCWGHNHAEVVVKPSVTHPSF